MDPGIEFKWAKQRLVGAVGNIVFQKKMYFPFNPLFYIVYYEIISPVVYPLGIDMFYFIEQVIIKVKGISKRQLID